MNPGPEYRPRMARKPNYDFERRKKEQERRDKKEAKREERARRKAAGLPEEIAFGALDENGDLIHVDDVDEDADEGDESTSDETPAAS
jgi:hypothetical protein